MGQYRSTGNSTAQAEAERRKIGSKLFEAATDGDRKFAHPPLNAPTGFFTGATGTASCRARLDCEKWRVADVMLVVVLLRARARLAGVRIREAIGARFLAL
jgi:hypothetical protein